MDDRINAGIPAMKRPQKSNISYELYQYEGAQHAFHNDTAPTRYNETAAKLAERTLAFFSKKLARYSCLSTFRNDLVSGVQSKTVAQANQPAI